MPTNRYRRTRGRRVEVQDWERRWALEGQLEGEDAAEPFFMSTTRAREVLEAVHEIPLADWLRQRLPEHPGQVLHGDAIVCHLTPEDLVVLEAGGNPFGP
jgi:hypothetical protein